MFNFVKDNASIDSAGLYSSALDVATPRLVIIYDADIMIMIIR